MVSANVVCEISALFFALMNFVTRRTARKPNKKSSEVEDFLFDPEWNRTTINSLEGYCTIHCATRSNRAKNS